MTTEELQAKVKELTEALEISEGKRKTLLDDVNKHRTRADELEAANAAREAALAKQAEAEEKTVTTQEQLKTIQEQLATLQAEREETAAQLAAEAERATLAERRAALTGKVADVDLALAVFNPEKHVLEDGGLNVDALLEAHPVLAPVEQRAPVLSSARGGVGGVPKPTPEEAAIQAAKAGNLEAAAMALTQGAYVNKK